MAQTQTKPQIRRKQHIPADVRTSDRDEAAKTIEEMWPSTLGEIADEAGYSVSHIHNTLDKYFERYTDFDEEQAEARVANDVQARESAQFKEAKSSEFEAKVQAKKHEVDIPEAYMDNPTQLKAYLHGWGDGYIDCRHDLMDVEEDNGGEAATSEA